MHSITHMSLLVTMACNLRCVYCYEDKTGAIMEESMAMQAIDWFIQKSDSMKVLELVFFGGEPLLNFPLIRAAAKYAEAEGSKHGKKFMFSVTTNGTLLTEEIIQFFKEHNFRVMISFEGTKELQDVQRPFASGAGSYDLTIPKLQALLKVLPNATAHSVIMGDTSPELVKDTLQELGFQRVTVAMNSQSLYSSPSNDQKLLRNTEHMLANLEEEAAAWGTLIRERALSSLRKLAGRSELYAALVCCLNQGKRKHFCGAGNSMVAVTPSGDLYLCHRFAGLEEYKVGSVFKDTLNFKNYDQVQVETNESCKACSARDYCGGGCKHDHVSATGSTNIPEEKMCNLKRHEYRLAAKVVNGLSEDDRSWLIKEKLVKPKPCPLDL